MAYVPIRGESWFDTYISAGRQSGGLYSIRQSFGKYRRVDVVFHDTLDRDSLILAYGDRQHRGLAVSADEEWLAISDNKGIYVRRRKDDELRHLVHPPEFTKLFEPAFSPDGRYLAAVGWGTPPHGPVGVAVSRAPDYSQFVTLAKTVPYVPWSVCWSPDGKWILVTVLRREEPKTAYDLVAVEVKTGKWFRLPQLYYITGGEALAVYPFGYADWGE